MKHSNNLRLILGSIGVFVVIGVMIILITFNPSNNPNTVAYFPSTGQANSYAQSLAQINQKNNSTFVPVVIQQSNGNGAFVTTKNNTNIISTNSTLAQNISDTFGTTPSVKLTATLLKTASDGTQTTDTGSVLVPQLAFLSSSGNSPDYSNGRFDLSFGLQTISQTQSVSGSGTLYVSINGVQLHPSGLPVTISNNVQNNTVSVKITTPLGINTKYTLNMNAQKFNTGDNLIKFSISSLSVSLDGKQYGRSNSTDIFSITLTYDPNRIIIKNTSGNYIKIFPSDDRLTISSQVFAYATYLGYTNACLTTQYPSHAGTINLLQNKQIISTTIDNMGTYLQRNSTYEIQVPTAAKDFFLKTPITQQNYDYSCASYSTIPKIPYYYCESAFTIMPITLSCNFPK